MKERILYTLPPTYPCLSLPSLLWATLLSSSATRPTSWSLPVHASWQSIGSRVRLLAFRSQFCHSLAFGNLFNPSTLHLLVCKMRSINIIYFTRGCWRVKCIILGLAGPELLNTLWRVCQWQACLCISSEVCEYLGKLSRWGHGSRMTLWKDI